VFFSIMDFRKATNLFADPDFDGDPVQIYEPGAGEPVHPDMVGGEDNGGVIDEDGIGQGEQGDPPNIDIVSPPDTDEPKKYYVNQVPVTVAYERVQYYGADGKLITESLKDYTKKNIHSGFASLDDFILKWNTADKKQELLTELAEQGILLEALREEVGKDMDDFDLVCHVAFDQPALTRKERADSVRKRNYFGKYSEQAQAVIEGLLKKYEDDGITSIEEKSVLKLKPLNDMGSPVELVRAFGKRNDFENAIKELEFQLYNDIA
jgi:type I restriction enzyme R subunit